MYQAGKPSLPPLQSWQNKEAAIQFVAIAFVTKMRYLKRWNKKEWSIY
jgi:hypothetical protein